ncbi:MAG TPA: hypothetical protein VLM80_10680 [Anaerolineales bacterium]|nr:hypothetical protein [Anaerolineales bacterium]
MKKTYVSHHESWKVLRALLPLLLLFLLPALSCSLPQANDNSLLETQSSLHIQETFAAEAAATNAAGELIIAATSTYLAEQQESSAEGTVQAQQATIAALETAASAQETAKAEKTAEVQPTATSPAEKPTNTPTTSSSDEIVITDWKLSRFAQITTGCYFANEICWKGDDRYDYLAQQVNLVLTSRETILIDSAWQNPTLAFWHTYDLPRPASVNIQTGGKWSAVANFSNGRTWHQVFIKLSQFKGKEITIQFLVYGKSSRVDPRVEWSIQDIKVIPNYTP